MFFVLLIINWHGLTKLLSKSEIATTSSASVDFWRCLAFFVHTYIYFLWHDRLKNFERRSKFFISTAIYNKYYF